MTPEIRAAYLEIAALLGISADEAEQDQLASRVRWILRDSGKAGRIAPAAIARAVASGALPSSVEQLAAYCHVDLEVAGRVMTVIREVRRG